NILCLALLVWLGLQLWRKSRIGWVRAAAQCLFLLLLLLPLNYCRSTFFQISYAQIIDLKRPALLMGCLIAGALVFWQNRRCARAAAIVLGIFSPFALFILLRLALFAFNVGSLAQPVLQGVLHPADPIRANQPRVLWIIFDESDQRL